MCREAESIDLANEVDTIYLYKNAPCYPTLMKPLSLLQITDVNLALPCFKILETAVLSELEKEDECDEELFFIRDFSGEKIHDVAISGHYSDRFYTKHIESLLAPLLYVCNRESVDMLFYIFQKTGFNHFSLLFRAFCTETDYLAELHLLMARLLYSRPFDMTAIKTTISKLAIGDEATAISTSYENSVQLQTQCTAIVHLPQDTSELLMERKLRALPGAYEDEAEEVVVEEQYLNGSGTRDSAVAKKDSKALRRTATGRNTERGDGLEGKLIGETGNGKAGGELGLRDKDSCNPVLTEIKCPQSETADFSEKSSTEKSEEETFSAPSSPSHFMSLTLSEHLSAAKRLILEIQPGNTLFIVDTITTFLSMRFDRFLYEELFRNLRNPFAVSHLNKFKEASSVLFYGAEVQSLLLWRTRVMSNSRSSPTYSEEYAMWPSFSKDRPFSLSFSPTHLSDQDQKATENRYDFSDDRSKNLAEEIGMASSYEVEKKQSKESRDYHRNKSIKRGSGCKSGIQESKVGSEPFRLYKKTWHTNPFTFKYLVEYIADTLNDSRIPFQRYVLLSKNLDLLLEPKDRALYKLFRMLLQLRVGRISEVIGSGLLENIRGIIDVFYGEPTGGRDGEKEEQHADLLEEWQIELGVRKKWVQLKKRTEEQTEEGLFWNAVLEIFDHQPLGKECFETALRVVRDPGLCGEYERRAMKSLLLSLSRLSFTPLAVTYCSEDKDNDSLKEDIDNFLRWASKSPVFRSKLLVNIKEIKSVSQDVLKEVSLNLLTAEEISWRFKKRIMLNIEMFRRWTGYSKKCEEKLVCFSKDRAFIVRKMAQVLLKDHNIVSSLENNCEHQERVGTSSEGELTAKSEVQ